MKQLNWYQIFGKSNIPDGRTVLPTDDIQIWLNCADIWDKAYTTLAEVLADTDTLLALITSNNAVDYMVRSTTWAVAQALVPIMTSNTTPSGVASASTEMSSTERAYRAFDRSTSTWWASSSATNQYLRYKFPNSVLIKACRVIPYNATLIPGSGYNACRLKDFSVKSSNDNFVTSNTLYSGTYSTPSADGEVHIFSDNTDECDSYSLEATNAYGIGVPAISELQFYSTPFIEGVTENATAMTYIGQNNYAANTLLDDATWCNAICNSEYFESVLNDKNPNMTDNTHPYGEVTASAVSPQLPTAASWKAFDDNSDTYWAGNGGQYPNNYCRYTFPTSKKMYLIKYRFIGGYSSTFTYTAKFQTSDDGVTWTDATDTYTFVFNGFEEKNGNVVLNGNTKRGYGIQILSCNNSGAYSFGVYEMRFYGRKDI